MVIDSAPILSLCNRFLVRVVRSAWQTVQNHLKGKASS